MLPKRKRRGTDLVTMRTGNDDNKKYLAIINTEGQKLVPARERERSGRGRRELERLNSCHFHLHPKRALSVKIRERNVPK